MTDNFPAGFLSRLRNLSEKELVGLCFKMAERHSETFIELVQALPKEAEIPVSDRLTIVEWSGGQVSLTNAQIASFRDQARDPSQKVQVIKRVREATNLGLKEAKDLVEEIFMK